MQLFEAVIIAVVMAALVIIALTLIRHEAYNEKGSSGK